MNASHEPEAMIAALSVRGLLDLADIVCASRGVTRQELCGRGRTQAAAAARQELWWLIRHHPERRYSLPEIARIVALDPSTIVYGLKAYRRRLASSKDG